jgi:hypothetical protein
MCRAKAGIRKVSRPWGTGFAKDLRTLTTDGVYSNGESSARKGTVDQGRSLFRGSQGNEVARPGKAIGPK